MTTDWSTLADRLTGALRLGPPPIAITFADAAPARVAPFDDPMSAPASDGRSGGSRRAVSFG